jgi:hypothetical protein
MTAGLLEVGERRSGQGHAKRPWVREDIVARPSLARDLG